MSFITIRRFFFSSEFPIWLPKFIFTYNIYKLYTRIVITPLINSTTFYTTSSVHSWALKKKLSFVDRATRKNVKAFDLIHILSSIFLENKLFLRDGLFNITVVYENCGMSVKKKKWKKNGSSLLFARIM